MESLGAEASTAEARSDVTRRLQLLRKLADTATTGLEFWLGTFGFKHLLVHLRVCDYLYLVARCHSFVC